MRRLIAVLALVALPLAGCGSAEPDGGGGTAPPPPPPADTFDLAEAMARIESSGFTPAPPEGPLPGPVRAIHSTCTGSANGRCQEVFVFHSRDLVGSVHAGLMRITGQNGTQVSLELPRYAPGGPGCCPSGTPSPHTLRVEAGKLVADPPIPEDPNGHGDS
ncbi:LppP/LprE family lipoprotein [Saccharopolyspora taberi]|uniref:LppP/LprE lipoprotein n=1 Tax=Saccharopolyspora taberi TaxID=60895 RepID=A0ABN3VC98_9PSEU